MQYLCTKQITVGGTTFHPGENIPDGVVLPERSLKLQRSGYISQMDEEPTSAGTQNSMFTQEQVNGMIAEAVSEAVAEMEQKEEELQQVVAELKEIEPGVYEGIVQISVKGETDGENEQFTAVSATPEEIQEAFSIMQLNAEEGSKAIADVNSENVLILLHAADSRKTIKEAAKKQADNLFSINGVKNEASTGNKITDINTEGADT